MRQDESVMQTFNCECGARVFFANSKCVSCQRDLLFVPRLGTMATVLNAGPTLSLHNVNEVHKRCGNQLSWGVCNWAVPADDPNPLCQACRLNDVIPDLSVADNNALWADVEQAKRHLIYTLNQLGLPVQSKIESPAGLSFRLMHDTPGREVLTGHADGVITLNMREADPVAREQARIDLREGYRTLLGHMRHEVGHYYWDLIIRDGGRVEGCRKVFGDERKDYAQALEEHYSTPPAPGWEQTFISVYAASHPWEDWAETWAHLLHMVDTLESAHHFGLSGPSPLAHGEGRWDMDTAIATWGEVSVALNTLNRSMGMPDPYPFTITPAIATKLKFVAQAIDEYS